ncbi:MAG: hypothetical protein WCL30_04625, partial [Pseudomonadota bacterium]
MIRKNNFFSTRNLITALSITAFIAVIATYISITRNAGVIVNDHITKNLLIFVGGLSLIFAAIVIKRALGLWSSLKMGSVGSRLQTRIVAMFSIVAILPTVIVSVFSAFFFNLGIESWFDERVSTALEESVTVSQIYIDEHKYTIRGDALAMAGDIEREIDNQALSDTALSGIINTQTLLRSLSDAAIIQNNHVIAQSQLAFSLTFERLSDSDITIADRGDVVSRLEGKDKVRALVKLKSSRFPDSYLLIGRLIDNRVSSHVDTAEGSVK